MKKFLALMFCMLLGSAMMISGCAPKKAAEQTSAPQMEEEAAPAVEEAAPAAEEAAPAAEEAAPAAE